MTVNQIHKINEIYLTNISIFVSEISVETLSI